MDYERDVGKTEREFDSPEIKSGSGYRLMGKMRDSIKGGAENVLDRIENNYLDPHDWDYLYHVGAVVGLAGVLALGDTTITGYKILDMASSIPVGAITVREAARVIFGKNMKR